MNIGLNWNPQENCTVKPGDIAPSLMRLNIIAGRDNIGEASCLTATGHSLTLLCHAQAAPQTDWWANWSKHLKEYLEALEAICAAVLAGQYRKVVAIEGWNEPNNWRSGTQRPELTIAQYEEITAKSYAICKRYGIPFISGPMFTHDQADGWEYITPIVRANCDYLGLHLYQSSLAMMQSMVAVWQALGKPIVISEVGMMNTSEGQLPAIVKALAQTGAIVQWFCLQSWRDQQWGIVNNDGQPNFRLAEYNAVTKTINQGGDTTVATRPSIVTIKAGSNTPVAITPAAPTRPATLLGLPSAQVYNQYTGDKFKNNENSSTEWLFFHTDGNGGILFRCAKQSGFEAYGILPALEYTKDDAIKIVGSVKLAVDYAKKYPAQKVICLSVHTDSGSDQHFGTFWLPGESQKYAACIEARLAKVWGFGPKFSKNMAGEGYYALGQGNTVPSNLILALVELASHATAANVEQFEKLVDPLAQAIVDATADYLGSTSGEDQDMEIEALKAQNELYAGMIANAKSEVDSGLAQLAEARQALEEAEALITRAQSELAGR